MTSRCRHAVALGYNAPVLAETASPPTRHAHRLARAEESRFRCADGRGDGSTVSTPLPPLRRRPCRGRDGRIESAAVGEREDVAPPRPRWRAGTGGRATGRRRSADAGRGSPLQRRSRRADHRHQHGLPGQEGVRRGERLGIAARRGAGRAHPADGGRRGRRAGHAEVPHRMVARAAQCRARRPPGRGRRRPHADAARAHAGLRVRRCGRVRHDRRRQARRVDPGRGQRRHRLAGEGAGGARRHRRRRGHDRPRRAGPAMDLPRDRALPGNGRGPAAAGGRRDPSGAAGTPAGALRLLRRGAGRAHGAQAHHLVHARAGRRRGLLRRHEPDRRTRDPGRRGGRVPARTRQPLRRAALCRRIRKIGARREAARSLVGNQASTATKHGGDSRHCCFETCGSEH